MDPYAFPASPSPGQLYPPTVDVPGRTQYQWDNLSQVWNVVPAYVALNEVGSYNEYIWPNSDGQDGELLKTDGDGNLQWYQIGATVINLGVLESIDGFQTEFTLVQLGTTTPFTPVPAENIVVFLGGVPQIPVESYSIAGNKITFTEAPPISTVFYAVSTTTL
jgi:hypothetical protein